jgi:quinol monooxygenase YgiN
MKTKLLAMLFITGLFLTSCGNNKTGENTQAADTLVTVPDPDYGMMIVAKVSIKPEKTKDFIEAAKEIIRLSNEEQGCSFYQLYQDPYDNSKFVFVEQYDNQAAVDAHFATEHFKGFGAKIGDMVLEPAQIKIVSVAKEVNQ